MKIPTKILLFALCALTLRAQYSGAGSGSGGAGGQYSGAAAVYSIGTVFLPPGGGLANSATETSVEGKAGVAGTISNFTVNVSAAVGASSTAVFTWRKNAADQAVTCTLTGTGAGGTTCSDLTHNFTVAVGDLIDIKVVVSGANTASTAVVMTWGLPGLNGATGATGPAPAGTGIVNVSGGVLQTNITTSAQLAAVISDETGSGAAVFATSPTLVTPTIGAATATTVNKVTITQPATGSTLTIPDGVTLTGPAASGTVATLGNTNTFTGRQDATGAASSAPFKTGTVAGKPATCVVGDKYFATDATAGQNDYNCTATNTWTQETGGGGGGDTITSPNSTLNVGGTSSNTTLDAKTTLIAQKFFGTTAPGSVTGNLPGDTYSDTTNHNVYQCNAASGTAAPACTAVTAGGWTLLNVGGGSIGGSGTTNFIPVLTGSTTLGNSVMSQDGTTSQVSSTKAINGPAPTAPAFSATPTIDLALCSRCEMPTLTANVTSVTFTHPKAGLKFSTVWPQGASAFTLTYGGGISACSLPPDSTAVLTQFFEVAADGSTIQPADCTIAGVSNLDSFGPTGSAPAVTPAAGVLDCRSVTATKSKQCIGDDGVFSYMVAPGSTLNLVGKTLDAKTTLIAQKFFGTAAPGSVTGNLPGDLYTDTTNHHEYVCNAPSGTAAPACTSVTAAGWLQVDGGGGGTVTGSGTTNTMTKWTSSSAVGNAGVTDNGTTIATTEVVDLSGGNLKLPSGAGATATSTNTIIIDSTANIPHIWANAADARIPFSVGNFQNSGLLAGSGNDGINTPSLFQLDGSGSILNGISGTAALTFQSAQDGNSNATRAGATFRGADITGAGGALAISSYVIVRGGNNATTNAAGAAGSLELIPGQATGAATPGLQGLFLPLQSYVKGTTATQFNLQCESAAMTAADCGASPNNWLGAAELVNSNTVQVTRPGAVVPINASAAVTLGHTVCAGSTAGKVTDSGGTSTCSNAQGATVGVVVAVAGTWPAGAFADGLTFTASTTLPLIDTSANIVTGALLSSGLGTGVGTWLATPSSANLAAAITDETGSGALTFATSPAFTTDIHCASAGGCTLGTAALPASSAFIGGSATNNFQITGTATAARVMTLPDVASATFVVAATSTTTTQALFASATAGAPAFRAIAAGDLPGTLSSGTAITNASLTTPSLGAATATSLLATGIVDGQAPITITTGTTANLGTTYNSGYTMNQEATAATGVTYTLPATATGKQYCVSNSGTTGVVNTGVLTVYPPASSFVILNGVVNTVGGGGTHGVASGGAAGDSACFVAIDATHWQVFVGKGTWAEN